jgi:hypothetical protein
LGRSGREQGSKMAAEAGAKMPERADPAHAAPVVGSNMLL